MNTPTSEAHGSCVRDVNSTNEYPFGQRVEKSGIPATTFSWNQKYEPLKSAYCRPSTAFSREKRRSGGQRHLGAPCSIVTEKVPAYSGDLVGHG